MAADRARSVAVVALLVLGLVTAVVWWAGRVPSTLPAAQDVPPPEPRTGADVEARSEAPAHGRTAAAGAPAPRAPDEADLSHPYSFRLEVRLQNEVGAPVPRALVYVAPVDCGFSLLPERSGESGAVALAWRARTRRMAVHVAVMAHGVLQPLRLVELREGEVGRVAIAVSAREQSLDTLRRQLERAARELPVSEGRYGTIEEVRRRHGRARFDELDVACGRTMLLFEAFRCVECHEPSRVMPYATFTRCGTIGAGLHPHARFRDLRRSGPDAAELRARRKQLEEGLEQRAAADPVAADERPEAATLTGVVFGADGEPRAKVPVVHVDEQGVVRGFTVSNASGRYRLTGLGPGAVHVVAGGSAAGVAEITMAMPPAGNLEWSAHLRIDRAVRGVVGGLEPGEVAGMRVELTRREGDWAAVTTVDGDGRFVVYGVPGPVDCLVWPGRDGPAPLPIHHGTSSLVDAAPVELLLHEELPMRARLRVHAALPQTHPRAQVTARVVQLATGRAAPLAPFGFEDAMALEPLAAGVYRVEMGAAELGWVHSEPIPIDGRGLWDVGAMHLPSPGRVVLRYAGDEDPLAGAPHAFYRRLEAVDVLEDHDRRGDEVELPAGRHVLVWQDGARLRAHEFGVSSGGRTELWLVPDGPPVDAAGRRR